MSWSRTAEYKSLWTRSGVMATALGSFSTTISDNRQLRSHWFHFHSIIIKLYCHIQRALHNELECSLALTHIVPIYTIK